MAHEPTIDEINFFRVWNYRAGAEALAAVLNANEAGRPDAWTHEARKFGDRWVVAAIDEDGIFAGHL